MANCFLSIPNHRGHSLGQGFDRKLAEGTFALQGHDPKSIIRYKNIRVKRLD